MSRLRSTLAPLVSLTLVASLLAGCGMTPAGPVPAIAASSPSVKLEAAARKETRAQAEQRAKKYIAEFNSINYRSIRSRTEMVQKIARTDADAAYEFLLDEIEALQDLRGEMKNITQAEAEAYEEMLLEQLDEMTPDQNEVKRRVQKAESLKLDLDELTVLEEMTAGGAEMVAQSRARVGSRNRLLTAIQESKLYKATKRAVKNTRAKIKKALNNLKKKLRWK